MGPYSHQHDRLIRIALIAVLVGLSLPAYAKFARRAEASGTELSWLGHLGIFALALTAGFAVMALFALALVAVERGIERAFSRRPPAAPAGDDRPAGNGDGG